jgi:hypothetical protein
MGYITDLTECTDPTAGDFLIIADASASADNRDRKVNVSEFALTEAINTFTLDQIMPTVRSGVTGSVADNGVYSFTPTKTRCLLVLSPQGTTGTMGAILGLIYCDTVAPATTALVVGTSVNLTTGVLTGTTGTDAKITVSAHTDGKIYIENRIGAARNWAYLVL